MRKLLFFTISIAILSMLFTGFLPEKTLADGTETLGPPSIPIASGSGIVAAGTGTCGLLGEITFIPSDIPSGASIAQVIIYWEGAFEATAVNPDGDNTIEVNGVEVTGVLIGGGPIGYSLTSKSYRADISALYNDSTIDIPGTIQISGLDFDLDGVDNECFYPRSLDDGAGILVIFDDGIGTANIEVRDGNDRAFILSPPPLDVTVSQTFTFPASASDRIATLTMFFSSVEGVASGDFRPSSIEITIGGTTDLLSNLLHSHDGDEWDTLNIPVTIPAGETMLTLQAFSRDDLSTGFFPASFNWLNASLSVPLDDEDGGEGCTPGYWKQPHHFDSWTAPYTPGTMFSDVFEDAFPGKTLLEVLSKGGGGLKALGRHTVAALLNAASADVGYDLSVSEVINMFNSVYPGSKASYNGVKDILEGFNELGCPLD